MAFTSALETAAPDCTSTEGPASASSPPFAPILAPPSTSTPAPPPASWKVNWLGSRNWLARFAGLKAAVVATSPPTLTTAPDPKTTPPGAENQTLPPWAWLSPATVEVSTPSMSTGPPPVMRLSTMFPRALAALWPATGLKT